MTTHPAAECPQCHAPLPPDAPAGLCPSCLMALNFRTETLDDADRRPAPPPEEIAPHFPQFEIVSCLGRGGMGVVYKARQKSLDRWVALKLLAPERADDPQFAARFEKEARALAALNHPNIVTIHDHGQAGGFYFLLMEYVDGVSLRQLLASERVSTREALAIVPQVCDALQYAHDQGIVHRDIKPENVLLDRRGRVKVADFGLAKIVADSSSVVPPPGGSEDRLEAGLRTEAGKLMGTPQYMSPEQIDAPGEVDHRADIYALGVVLYEMLTGERPDKDLVAPSRKVRIDVRLDEVVLRALEKDPELRYQQASVLKTRVETISAEPERETGASALLKSERGRLGIQEFPGMEIPYPEMGEIALHSDRLVISQGYRRRVIPLQNVRGLGETVMNWWFSPAGHRSAGVEFEEDGKLLKLAFLPGTALFRTVEDTRVHSAEWMLAIQSAAEAATGRKPPVRDHPELMRVRSPWIWGWAALPVLFAGLLLLQPGSKGAALMLLLPLILLPVLIRRWQAIQPRNAMPAAQGGPPAGVPPWALGNEYRSPRMFCGLPLVHVAHGIDPETGKPRHARGIVAVGNTATGWVAIGGRAYGGIAMGGVALGGIAAGVVSFGGLVIALLAAFGGQAIAPVAVGGIAIGWVAIGGTALGVHVSDGKEQDAETLRQLYRAYQPYLMAVMGGFWVALLALAFAISAWAKRRNHTPARPWGIRSLSIQLLVAIATALIVRAFLLESYVAATGSAAPEIPQGSHFLVWKPARHFSPGDLVAYKHEGRVNVSRVVADEPEGLRVGRNGESDRTTPRADVLGRVVSILWRGSAAASAAKVSATDRERLELSLAAAERSFGRIKALHAAGVVTQAEYDKAEGECLILRAELDGDAARASRLELEIAERNFNHVKTAADAGVVSQAELDKAREVLDRARLAVPSASRQPREEP